MQFDHQHVRTLTLIPYIVSLFPRFYDVYISLSLTLSVFTLPMHASVCSYICPRGKKLRAQRKGLRASVPPTVWETFKKSLVSIYF